MIRDQLLVAHAAREAARAASVADGDRGAAAARAAARSGGLDPSHLEVGTAPVDGGEGVKVHVSYESVTDVPLVGLLVPDIGLQGEAVMRVEQPGGARSP